jgi:catechol 2,3-dioxygenase-like lactoylglutathione lyase family enzyme
MGKAMTVVIDHISIGVADIARSAAFYDAVLAPLGIVRRMSFEDAVGYQRAGAEDTGHFWIGLPEAGRAVPQPGLHVAFGAASRAAVDAFYAAAIAAGGRDNGAPGLRPHYHADYYGAFATDPDGHHIEAVCHRPL